jgi:hypothetical protein
MKTMNNFQKSIYQLNAEANQVRTFLNKDLEAWIDADDKAVQLWMYLQAMSEALMKNNQSVHALQAVFVNATTLIQGSSIALEASLESYNRSIGAIESRVSMLLSRMRMSTLWSPLFLTLLLSFDCLLLQPRTSWKLRFATFLPIAYHTFEIIRCFDWELNFRTTIPTLAIFSRHPWLSGIAVGVILLTLCVVGLYNKAVVGMDEELLPQVEAPYNV